MPELPEVESAARELRAAVVGRSIQELRLTHPSLQRRASKAQLKRIAGKRVDAVLRRGKHQLLELDDGSIVHVHFRMAGDWVVSRVDRGLPRHARAVLDLDDGTRVALVDPRALSTVTLHDAGAMPDLGVGPEPDDPSFGPDWLATVLARRRSAIKPALLDQRVVAGVGNIYAAEALWRARLSPLAPASSLGRAELRHLVSAIRAVLDAGLRRPGRYANAEETGRFAVYDREGEPCRRCRTPIARIVQVQRSTYYCPGCQLQRPAPKVPRREVAGRSPSKRRASKR
jgi:formamidopyrimidine-DNA glycosylase